MRLSPRQFYFSVSSVVSFSLLKLSAVLITPVLNAKNKNVKKYGSLPIEVKGTEQSRQISGKPKVIFKTCS